MGHREELRPLRRSFTVADLLAIAQDDDIVRAVVGWADLTVFAYAEISGMYRELVTGLSGPERDAILSGTAQRICQPHPA